MKTNYQWDNIGPGTGIQVALQHPGGVPQGTLIVPAKGRNLVKQPGGDWTMLNYDAPTGGSEYTIVEHSEGFYRNDRDAGNAPAYQRRVLVLEGDLSVGVPGQWYYDSALDDPLCHASIVNTGGDFGTMLFMNPVGDEFALGALNPPNSAERSPMWVKFCSNQVSIPGCWSAGRQLDAERGGYSSMVMFDDTQVVSLQEWLSRTASKNDARNIVFRRFNLDWVMDTTLTQQE